MNNYPQFTPSPASYRKEQSYEHLKKQSPKYSIKFKHESQHKQDNNPGPGAYYFSPKSETVGHKMPQQIRFKQYTTPNAVPGPQEYQIQSIDRKVGIAFRRSDRTSNNKFQLREDPGPADYKIDYKNLYNEKPRGYMMNNAEQRFKNPDQTGSPGVGTYNLSSKAIDRPWKIK
ncbi:SHIPPO_repeat domain-containing protein [Hexamita inflata]|uniref:SHIPPO repeat domain-containing protein n=1 Tax=Hexamita inflata TaxID=28002 RepID=A0AA86QB41_9EUKA|nr:SHIPPO repeat domain-containing protein [Hexamita inflata]